MVRSRHKNILAAIFLRPTSGTIRWRDLENALVALGANITEGSGSRIRISLNGQRIVMHRPHPKPNTDKGAIKTLRVFLTKAGVKQ